MSVSTSNNFIAAFGKTLGLLFLYIAVGLFIDSQQFTNLYRESQWIANCLMIVVFSIVLYKVSPRIKEQMLYALIIGFVGEYLFSIVLGMYTYRLNNVPHYIPMGHAIVYIGVLYFTKTKYVKRTKESLEKIFTVLIFLYSLCFLIFKNDVFGFVMTLAVLLAVKNKPKEKLFYLTMYLTVAYLEIVGTSYYCWEWPVYAFDKFAFIRSANPPSGISLFYFLLDLGCLWLYKKKHIIAWKRMKHIRAIKAKNV